MALNCLLLDQGSKTNNELKRKGEVFTASACFSGTKAIYLKRFRYVALEALSLLDSWTV